MQGIRCQVRVKGHLRGEWSNWFENLTITNDPDGEAVLTGTLVDDTALYGVLMKMRDIGLSLLTFQRDPLQEEEEL